MTEARIDSDERREWNRLSHLIAAVANAIGGAKKKPAEFNPYRQNASSGGGAGGGEIKEHVSVLRDVFSRGHSGEGSG